MLGRVRSRIAIVVAVAALLTGGALPPSVSAQTPDRSDVVLVLDFSASILREKADRNRFGAALERIADRVVATTSDLVAGDVTVSIVRFASRAADYRGCTGLKLLGNEAAVAQFARCLRAVASAYRKGLDPGLTRKIGVDTNYVAAMQRAATHLPADAVRPAMILFTDGKHDVKGVPNRQVRIVRERLFSSRSPFALLPVGMGLDPKQRATLETGLTSMRIVTNMPPCVSGETFDWPQVVFESPDEAGNAVAVALQEATCTFTVEEAPPPAPKPTPGAVRGIRLTAHDGGIELSWVAPAESAARIVGYRARCRAGDGDWIQAEDVAPTELTATVEGLTNGMAYRCEVAAVGSVVEGAWTPATSAATPLGRPAAPGKPTVEALDRAVRIGVTPTNEAGVSGYAYECSNDGGTSWTRAGDVGSAGTTLDIGNLTNGVRYICRAYAANLTGLSEPSAVSDSVMPCGGILECNSLLQPILAFLSVVLAGALLAVFIALFRGRTRGYVVAVVDVVHVANLGHGKRLGIGFVRAPDKRVVGIVADTSAKPDIQVRQIRGGRFEVIDRSGRRVTSSGERVVAVDSTGGRHDLVLQAFATNTASEVASR
jgi:hypothetical protein